MGCVLRRGWMVIQLYSGISDVLKLDYQKSSGCIDKNILVKKKWTTIINNVHISIRTHLIFVLYLDSLSINNKHSPFFLYNGAVRFPEYPLFL